MILTSWNRIWWCRCSFDKLNLRTITCGLVQVLTRQIICPAPTGQSQRLSGLLSSDSDHPVPSLVRCDTTLSSYWRRRSWDTDLSVHTLHGTTWHIAPSQTRHTIDTGDPSQGRYLATSRGAMSTGRNTGSVTLLYPGAECSVGIQGLERHKLCSAN